MIWHRRSNHMAINLMSGNYTCRSVYDKNQKVAELVSRGAIGADSVLLAAKGQDMVIILPENEELDAVLSNEDGLLAGSAPGTWSTWVPTPLKSRWIWRSASGQVRGGHNTYFKVRDRPNRMPRNDHSVKYTIFRRKRSSPRGRPVRVCLRRL